MSVQGVGKLSFKTCDLKNVMYIPDLTTNLLSVGAITDNDGEVTFTKDKVTIKHSDQVILRGKKLQNGLFGIDLESAMKKEASLTVNGAEKATWHRKLGHIHKEELKQLIELTDDLDIRGCR